MKECSPLELLAQNPLELSLVSFKSKLMVFIVSIIRENEWTQSQAADILGVSQPRISNIFKGKTSKFSIDALLEIAGKLGYLMDLKFDPSNRQKPLSMKLRKAAA